MNSVLVHFLSPFLPLHLGQPRASGYCSQSERLLFGRDTKNLRRSFRRCVGRNLESRRREAAGRRNYPEAVPDGDGRNGDGGPKQISSIKARTGGRGGKAGGGSFATQNGQVAAMCPEKLKSS